MKLKVGDKVVVIAGSSKGKEGKITKTFKDENKVIVEGVNIVKKQKKAKINIWLTYNKPPTATTASHVNTRGLSIHLILTKKKKMPIGIANKKVTNPH